MKRAPSSSLMSSASSVNVLANISSENSQDTFFTFIDTPSSDSCSYILCNAWLIKT